MKVWDFFSIDSINGSPEKITYWGKYIAILVIIDKPLTICQVPARWQDIFSTSNLISFQLLSLYLKLCKEIYLNQHAHPWWSYNTTLKSFADSENSIEGIYTQCEEDPKFLAHAQLYQAIT